VRKIISFSLWGSSERYTLGALRNIDLASELYPDWTCRFYLGKSVPTEVITSLVERDNTEIFIMNETGDWSGMFWRFYPASESDVDVMISRDTDSRLTLRERDAVDEWLASKQKFHIMRDHPYHGVPILGGMWGAKRGALPHMKKMIHEYSKGEFWQVDQDFLRDKVFPLVQDDMFVHDEFFSNRPFPHSRDEKHFVGQAYAGDDKILDDDEYFIDRAKEMLHESTR
jgi:hypothetical protein